MTKELLLNQVQRLETNGTTALGPAVLSGVSLAAQGLPGSTVIISTDGKANEGLGSLQGGVKFSGANKTMDQVADFYEQVGHFAQTHGITINVLSI